MVAHLRLCASFHHRCCAALGTQHLKNAVFQMHAVPAQTVEMLVGRGLCTGLDPMDLMIDLMVLIKDLFKVVIADLEFVDFVLKLWKLVKDVVFFHAFFRF